jgi:hypothetical protein
VLRASKQQRVTCASLSSVHTTPIVKDFDEAALIDLGRMTAVRNALIGRERTGMDV